MIDHDRLFKELLKEFFHEFLDLFLPDLAAYVERRPVTFLDAQRQFYRSGTCSAAD